MSSWSFVTIFCNHGVFYILIAISGLFSEVFVPVFFINMQLVLVSVLKINFSSTVILDEKIKVCVHICLCVCMYTFYLSNLELLHSS